MSACLNKAVKLASALLVLLVLNACATQMRELKGLAEAYTPESVRQYSAELAEINRSISTDEEIQIGERLISAVLGAAPLVDNGALQRYVNDVGSWVARQSERPELPWRFGVIDSTGINAFAAPGGYVVLTRGLFNLIEDEAQLAGVLAHEIGHVVEKHHLIALKQTMNQEFWAQLGLDLVGNPELLDRLLKAGIDLYASGLDRKYEYRADLWAVVLNARAGYDPYAFLNVLAAIDSINPSRESLEVLLKTHPPTGQRIAELSGYMESRLDRYGDGRVNRERFETVRADARL